MGRRIGGKVNWLKVFNAVLERKVEGFFWEKRDVLRYSVFKQTRKLKFN